MRKRTFTLLLSLAVTISYTFSANRPVGFSNYKHEDGLKNRYARYVTEDHQGFLWVATNGGMYRFDGANFKSYTATSSGPGLLSNKCRTVFVDSQGGIWVGTNHGLHKYAPLEDQFKAIQLNIPDLISVYPAKNGIASTDIKCFLQLDHQLLVGTRRNGIICIDIRTNKVSGWIRTDNFKGDINLNDVSVLLAWKDKQIIAGMDNVGLVNLNLQDSSAAAYPNSYNQGIPSPFIKSLVLDSDSNLWIGSDAGLTKALINKQQPEFHHYFGDWISNPTPSYVKDVKLIGKDIWCATDEGIWILDAQTHLFTNMRHDDKDEVSVLHDRTKHIFQDSNNTTWVATDNGLSKYVPDLFIFSKSQLDDPQQTVVIEQLDTLTIIGTPLGVDLLGRSFKKHIPTALLNHLILHQDGLLVATSDGLFQLSNLLGNVRYTRLLEGNLTYILKDDQDRIWAGTELGLFVNQPNDPPTSFLPVGQEMLKRGVTCIEQIGPNDMLISQWNPLLDESLVQLTLDKNTENWTCHNRAGFLQVNDLEPAKNGYWIATNEEGLLFYDQTWTRTKSFDLGNGFPSSDAKAIVTDSTGHVWVSTMRGIALIEHGIRLTQKYAISNGLPHREFKKHSAFYHPNGLIYFGAMNGWSMHDPERIVEDLPYSKPHFRLINSGSGEWNSGQLKALLDNQEPVILQYTDQVFNVSMSSINLGNNDNSTIAFRLKGFDKQWRKVRGSQAEISYTNIPPGSYIMELRAANEKGHWGQEALQLNILITPPFWKTWWFRIGSGLLLAVLIVTISRSYLNRIKRREAVSRQIVELEQKALRSQMNPHFIFNSLNSIQAFIGKNESDLAIDYLSSFSKLMRMILQSSIDGKITVDQEVEILNNYIRLEQIRFDHSFTFDISIDQDIESDIMKIPPMLIQPAVENAIIHGVRGVENAHIQISFEMGKGETIFCTVQDNGKGRQAASDYNADNRSKDHVSTAVRVTEERLQFLFNTEDITPYYQIQDLKSPDNKPAGTRVKIGMPVVVEF